MALFARVAKLGFVAYGARHARVRPSVMQCVLAIRETVVIKPSRLNIVAQCFSNFFPVPFLSLYTHLSLSLSLSFNKRGRAACTLNTHRQASLMASRYTTDVPPLRSCIGPAREAGLSTGT